jgi:hypothetical protein
MCRTMRVVQLGIVTGLMLAWSPAPSSAQGQSQTFTATASLKTKAGAETTAPVTIVITRLTTDSERDAVVGALKKDGTPGVVKSLKAMGDAGYIEVGERRTPLKYAYARPMSGGRLITVIAAAPIVHLGAGLPDAKPKTGFDLALALLDVKDAGSGTGELVPAATVKVNETGAIQTQDYGAETVRLTNVQAKK